MKIINREHGGGKTTALVWIMFEPGNEDVVFVAPTKAQANIGYQTAVTSLGKKGGAELRDRFISVSEFQSRKGRNERYVFDEIEEVIRYLIGAPVVAIAGTDEGYKIAYRVKRGYEV